MFPALNLFAISTNKKALTSPLDFYIRRRNAKHQLHLVEKEILKLTDQNLPRVMSMGTQQNLFGNCKRVLLLNHFLSICQQYNVQFFSVIELPSRKKMLEEKFHVNKKTFLLKAKKWKICVKLFRQKTNKVCSRGWCGGYDVMDSFQLSLFIHWSWEEKLFLNACMQLKPLNRWTWIRVKF